MAITVGYILCVVTHSSFFFDKEKDSSIFAFPFVTLHLSLLQHIRVNCHKIIVESDFTQPAIGAVNRCHNTKSRYQESFMISSD